MEVREQECGESERRPVIGWIGIAPQGNIILRESGQTSAWSFVTKESDELSKEEKQMTVQQAGTGASSDRAMHWNDVDWARCYREIRRLPARIVKATQDGKYGKVKLCSGC
nr:reverse transcriptase N-terminal domain-containing protein [Paraburkholderia sp. BL6665CI2N2]